MSYRLRKTQKNNFSGYTGVYWNKYTREWETKIKYNGLTINMASFKDIENAIMLRKKAVIACDAFKALGVESVVLYKYSDGDCYFTGVLPNTNSPIYVYGGRHEI